MKRVFLFVSIFILIFSITSCSKPAFNKNTVYQISTINALLEGVYDGTMTYGKLKKYGNFGIGTFNALDGEMICVDGKFFQIKSDGKVYKVKDNVKTPFAVVTRFKSDKFYRLNNLEGYDLLQNKIKAKLPTKNIFYAIKIKGKFSYIKTRSVPRQNKPYPPLVQVVKNQPTFEYNNISGTIIGYWCPSYVKGINVTGFHFHFIDDARKVGGHLLKIKIDKADMNIQYITNFFMILPDKENFFNVNLSGDRERDIHAVER